MDTCIICHMAYDPIWDEDGKLLLDPDTQICKKCMRKIENGEVVVDENLKKKADILYISI